MFTQGVLFSSARCDVANVCVTTNARGNNPIVTGLLRCNSRSTYHQRRIRLGLDGKIRTFVVFYTSRRVGRTNPHIARAIGFVWCGDALVLEFNQVDAHYVRLEDTDIAKVVIRKLFRRMLRQGPSSSASVASRRRG
ncbi:hypothetical protein EXIGLDRAFT_781353 [Exidia glandulosa HHB12029]|uniref:Uncharacterized protein n=1 Tax=Exidia glandulosa HHB12029 TaxID=1314781 RepID=A0A165B9V4_EXIGL|nr:hypothetical protein EXIGLDRAFT_781344 [Exidia glandulosa HHB12029]KZV80152.1 hypothetical protein EXIGLDRAFT_781353 [Exidia glandulosa HHB12029]